MDAAITIAIATETGYHQTYNNPFQLSNNSQPVTQNFGMPIPNQTIFNPVLPIQQPTSSNNQPDILSVIQELTKQVKNINTRNFSSRPNNTGYNYRSNNNTQQRKCYACNGYGHIARDCPNNKNNFGRTFNNNNNNNNGNNRNFNNFNRNNNNFKNNTSNNFENNQQQQNIQSANLASQNEQISQLIQQIQSQLQSNTSTSSNNNVSDNNQHLK